MSLFNFFGAGLIIGTTAMGIGFIFPEYVESLTIAGFGAVLFWISFLGLIGAIINKGTTGGRRR